VTNNQIDVDDDVLDVLKRHAEPFVDTPNSVLRRLLGVDDGTEPKTPEPAVTSANGAVRGHRQTKRAAKTGTTETGTTRTRAKAGSILAEDRYELPLLTALIDLGGRAAYRDVLEAVGKQLEPELTPLDKDKLKSGDVRWENRLQFVRLRLIERGLLERDTPRGIWGITDNGRTAAEKGQTR
jgi:hypothetical protein